MKEKSIDLLIGQKGSGKSFIGTLMEDEFGIKFLRVEDWAKQVKRERDFDNLSYIKEFFLTIERLVRTILEHNDEIVFESTGLSDSFDQMLENLRHDFLLITIGIKANDELCLDRVSNRDQTIHINISDDQIMLINKQVLEKKFYHGFYYC